MHRASPHYGSQRRQKWNGYLIRAEVGRTRGPRVNAGQVHSQRDSM